MKPARKTRYAIPVSFLISASSLFAQATWTGTGTSGTPVLWSDSANWAAGSIIPINSQTTGLLTFNNLSANSFSTNNLTGLTVGGITVLKDDGAVAPATAIAVKDNTITGNAFTLSGDVSVATGNFQNINTGINLSGNRTFNITNGQLTLGGTVADSTTTGAITKSGGATLALSGNNSYTGTTTVSAGNLVVNHNNALGSTSAGTSITGLAAPGGAGNTVNLKNGITVTGETLTLSTTGSTTRASLFVKDTNGVSAWNGNVNIAGGGQGAFWAENGATLTVGASSADTITGDGQGQFNLRGATGLGTGIINSSIDLTGGNLTVNMGVAGSSWTLKGNNTNIGAYTVIGTGVTLQFANTQSLHGGNTANWTAAKIKAQNNTTLAFNVGGTGEFTSGNVTTLLTNLSGANGTSTTGFSSGSRIAFDTTNATGGSFTIDGAIVKQTTGTLGLTKLGTNTLVLTGTNTYTGTTLINAGTLLINGNSSAATGAVTVDALGTLGGSGTIGGATTVNGTLSAGNSPGLLTFSSSLSLAGTTLMELAGSGVAGTDFDQVNVGGLITFGGALSISSFGGYNIGQAASYDLFSFGSTSGDFSGVSVAGTALANSAGTWFGTANGFNYSFSQATGDLSVSAVSAVPEPSTYAFLAGLAILGFVVYRRQAV